MNVIPRFKEPPRCEVCGRFIGMDEFERGEIKTDAEPDSHFGPEKIEHIHRECD